MEYITARGGEVQLNSRLQEIELADDGNVAAFRLTDGRRMEGDLYISSMPGRYGPTMLRICACSQQVAARGRAVTCSCQAT